MDLIVFEDLDWCVVMVVMLLLIKVYLCIGGFIGEGVYLDCEFNIIDVFLMMDIVMMLVKYCKFYEICWLLE